MAEPHNNIRNKKFNFHKNEGTQQVCDMFHVNLS